MYKLMFDLESMSYEESRLEYFRAQKAHCERCLDYWVKAMRKGKAVPVLRTYCACNAVKTKRKEEQ